MGGEGPHRARTKTPSVWLAPFLGGGGREVWSESDIQTEGTYLSLRVKVGGGGVYIVEGKIKRNGIVVKLFRP